MFSGITYPNQYKSRYFTCSLKQVCNIPWIKEVGIQAIKYREPLSFVIMNNRHGYSDFKLLIHEFRFNMMSLEIRNRKFCFLSNGWKAYNYNNQNYKPGFKNSIRKILFPFLLLFR